MTCTLRYLTATLSLFACTCVANAQRQLPADMPTTDAPRILYVYDALCGWCYGFSPALGEFVEAHPDLPVEVVSGGMIVGEREGPIGEVAAYIKQAYKDVERATGVEFGQDFITGPLERGDMMMSSVPPARLLAWSREQAPDKQYEAANALQRGIYFHGFGPGSEQLATFLAEQLSLKPADAIAALTDERYADPARRDFALTQQLGVRGFPAVFLVRGQTAYPLANGYTGVEQLEERLASIEGKKG